MMSNPHLLVFALSFAGCVLAIPVVTRLAAWIGAIDRPDHFRRIHVGSIPRLGGLGLAWGIASGLMLAGACGILQGHPLLAISPRHASIGCSVGIILLFGVLDDTRGASPRLKLLGQVLAVLALYLGGMRIQGLELFGLVIPLSYPTELAVPGLGVSVTLDLPSLTITLLWFLGCMNVWNLIDGMDGLASGVGLLVSGTLLLVAIYHGNEGAAALSAALAGSLAGFLLYNWHPACIFLGDCGSLLLGLVIGIVGVQCSTKGTSAASLLFPVVAMGLPITDTAMAIFRRWVRDLPLSSADRRHIHHLLIGLGLTPRQAAVVLYFFTAGLCGVVLLGVAWRSEALALGLGVSGCLAFLLVLTSRRDELSQLVFDLRERRRRRRQERQAARLTWESIQRLELASGADQMATIMRDAAEALGVAELDMELGAGEVSAQVRAHARAADADTAVCTQIRLHGLDGLRVRVSFMHGAGSPVESDIALRAIQRLASEALRRLERFEPAHSRERIFDGPGGMQRVGGLRTAGRVKQMVAEVAGASGRWLEPEPPGLQQG